MRAAVHQVVTFASSAFEGNPAFVLSVDDVVDEATLVKVCRQLQAGILAVLGTQAGGRRDLAFYTSHGPHNGAGHSAHAAASVALQEDGDIVFDVKGGQPLAALRKGEMLSVVWPSLPAAAVRDTAGLAAALGRQPGEAYVADFGYVAIFADASVLADLRPDMALIRTLDRGAIIATAPGRGADFGVRVFAPNLGLPEDPVCGTAHRILAPYWGKVLQKDTMRSRQMSARGGDLWCAVEGDAVTISGRSKLFLEGAIELP